MVRTRRKATVCFNLLSATTALALGGGACQSDSSPSESRSQFDLELVEVSRYGWESLDGHRAQLGEVELQNGGAVLGDILDIVEDSSGYVYALDAAFQKIVVFKPDGGFDRLILGGLGRGPGEFLRPRSLSIGSNGDVWVYDQLASQVTRFSADGIVQRVLPVPNRMLHIVIKGEYLYGVGSARENQKGVLVLDTTGRVIEEVVAPTQADLLVGAGRADFGAGVDESARRVLVAHESIGVWSSIDSLGVSTTGAALFPDARPVETTGANGLIRATPLHEIWGIGSLTGDRIAIYYANLSHNPRISDEGSFRLAIFRHDGTHLGSLGVPTSRGTFHMSAVSDEILVVQEEPYPQVVRFRLSETRGYD